MKCMHPLSLVLDGKRQYVPCGTCNFCLETRRAHWSFRLAQEEKVCSSSIFVTFTYEESKLPSQHLAEGLPGIGTLRKRDLQLFLKRLRKVQSGVDSTRRVRYYAVGEYGTKYSRPHYHALLFNLSQNVIDQLHDIWAQGHIMVGTVTPASIHYVTKYHVNPIPPEDLNGRDPPFCLMSRKPGIGANYLVTHSEYHMYADRLYTNENGFKRSLPRYYRDKMFAERAIDISQWPTETEVYSKEIEELSKVHDDPHHYYLERRRFAYDSVKHKSNKNNKL